MPLAIRGYLKTSLIEWPGKIAAVVFLPNCNFRCSFCHNSDLVLRPETLDAISAESVLSDLDERRNWVDGVAITGGEPTLWQGLIPFLRNVKKLGLLTMLETNGTNPELLEKLFTENLLDNLSMDIKGPLDDRYEKITGVKINLSAIKKSMQLIHYSGVSYEFRTTVVPGIHSKKDLIELAGEISWARAWFLQQFVPHNTINPELTKQRPYSKSEMKAIERAVQKYVKSAQLRGVS